MLDQALQQAASQLRITRLVNDLLSGNLLRAAVGMILPHG